VTGIAATGAKPGTADSRAAIREHKQVLAEMKNIKPTLKTEGKPSVETAPPRPSPASNPAVSADPDARAKELARVTLETARLHGFGEVQPGQSYRDAKKSANPDEKADAKLGERIEGIVEAHMLANKEAEKKEGHPIMKAGMSLNDMRKMQELGKGSLKKSASAELARVIRSGTPQEKLAVARAIANKFPELKKGVDDMFTMSEEDRKKKEAEAKKAQLGSSEEQFATDPLKPQEVSLDAEASRREGEAAKEKEALARQAKVSGQHSAQQSATVKSDVKKDDSPPPPPPPPQADNPFAAGINPDKGAAVANVFKGASYNEMRKYDHALASRNIRHNMHHLSEMPGGRKQAVAAGINEAKEGKDVTKNAGLANDLGRQFAALQQAFQRFTSQVAAAPAPVAAGRDRIFTRAAAGLESRRVPVEPLVKSVVPRTANAQAAAAAESALTDVGRRRIQAEATVAGPHGQSYNDYRAQNGE